VSVTMTYKNLKRPAQLHRWLMNFVGGAVGFAAPVGLYLRFTSLARLDWLDLVLALVAFYGVNDMLPRVLLSDPPWKHMLKRDS
jgi:hypothetical protein